MKTVNLLPGWYRQQQKRQRNTRVHLGVMLVMGAAMIGTTFLGQRQLNGLRRQRDALAIAMQQCRDPQQELAQKKADLQRLENLQATRRELGNTVPMSAVIQQLQNAMSKGMALSNVLIDVHSDPVKGSGFVGDAKNPPRYHDVAQIVVQGIAPNNDNIASFIEQLSHNSLFADPTLDYTRTTELQRVPVRRFQIQLTMDLEPLTTQAGDAIASGDTTNGH